ncbi:hypothetical protein SFK218_0785 [Shigella flexneri K-218]|nr:hypothetical protein SFK218_0785 [Shigella flexneri K-218]
MPMALNNLRGYILERRPQRSHIKLSVVFISTLQTKTRLQTIKV